MAVVGIGRKGELGAAFRRCLTILAAAVCILQLLFTALFMLPLARGVPSGWGVPQLLEHDDTGNATNPRIALNDDRFGISAWVQSNGSRTSIWGARLLPGVTWQPAVLLEFDDSGDAEMPDVGIDEDGNAFVIWVQSNGSRVSVWGNRCDPSGVWEGPSLLETNDTGNATDPALAVDPSGDAFAVWAQDGGRPLSIWANRFERASQKWGGATLIETDDSSYARYPDVAIGGDGSAFAVWYLWADDIYANRWDPVTRLWGTATIIDQYPGYAWYCKVGVDAAGNALAAWTQTYNGAIILYARRYQASSRQWGTIVDLTNSGQGWAYGPDLAVDQSGNGIVVWHQWDDHSTGVWAKRFSPMTGWGKNLLLETLDTPGYYPSVAMNPRGDAIVVWRQKGAVFYGIWANRYSAATGAWLGAELVARDDLGDGMNPRIAIDSGGNGTVVWQLDSGGIWNAWANSFSRGLPPTLEADGTPGFEGDGVNPGIGVVGRTVFTYKVRYIDPDNDAPLTGTPGVHILKGGTPLPGSPFLLLEVEPWDTDFTDGKTYSYSTTLAATGNDYSYYFIARDNVNQSAADWPSPEGTGPTIVPPTATVVGKVRSDGLEVPGASLSLRNGTIVTDQTSSDSEGNFTFTGIEPGTYSVEASKQGYFPDAVDVTVAAGDVASVSLSLLPMSGTLNVTVMMDSSPAAEAAVKVRLGGAVVAQGRTDENGLIAFSSLAPGTYAVKATWACRSSKEETVDIAPGETQNVTLVLDPVGINRTVEVSVRGDSGPLPGATVSLLNGEDAVVYESTTDADGLVRFLDVAYGTYRVLVRAPGFIESSTQISIGQCDGDRTFGPIVLTRELVPGWLFLLLFGILIAVILIAIMLVVLRRRRRHSRRRGAPKEK